MEKGDPQNDHRYSPRRRYLLCTDRRWWWATATKLDRAQPQMATKRIMTARLNGNEETRLCISIRFECDVPWISMSVRGHLMTLFIIIRHVNVCGYVQHFATHNKDFTQFLNDPDHPNVRCPPLCCCCVRTTRARYHKNLINL